jgi:hypothetical protein
MTRDDKIRKNKKLGNGVHIEGYSFFVAAFF